MTTSISQHAQSSVNLRSLSMLVAEDPFLRTPSSRTLISRIFPKRSRVPTGAVDTTPIAGAPEPSWDKPPSLQRVRFTRYVRAVEKHLVESLLSLEMEKQMGFWGKAGMGWVCGQRISQDRKRKGRLLETGICNTPIALAPELI